MDSLFDLHISILSKQIFLNVPSTPVTSIAFTSILVSRNGTFSGTCSRLIWKYKKTRFLWCYLHGIFERVAKVNMSNLPRGRDYQDIADVSIAQAEYIANHAHHSQRANKIGSALEPYISWCRLKPENSCEIVSSVFCYFLNVLEHFNFLQNWTVLNCRVYILCEFLMKIYLKYLEVIFLFRAPFQDEE